MAASAEHRDSGCVRHCAQLNHSSMSEHIGGGARADVERDLLGVFNSWAGAWKGSFDRQLQAVRADVGKLADAILLGSPVASFPVRAVEAPAVPPGIAGAVRRPARATAR